MWWTKNYSSNGPLAKQTSLLWRNKEGNNSKKVPEKHSLLNIARRMKGHENQVKLTYSGKAFAG